MLKQIGDRKILVPRIPLFCPVWAGLAAPQRGTGARLGGGAPTKRKESRVSLSFGGRFPLQQTLGKPYSSRQYHRRRDCYLPFKDVTRTDDDKHLALSF